MDPVSEILRSVRLDSGLVARAEGKGRWGVQSGGMPCALFHAVVRGNANFRTEQTNLDLLEGDVVLLCRGDAHVIADDAETEPRPYGSFPMTRTGPIPTLHAGIEGAGASLLCGSFAFQHAASDHFASFLPHVIHVQGQGGTVPWLDSSVRLLLESLEDDARGGETLIARILDTFFVQVLRAHLEAHESDCKGWLAALMDDRIGKALAIIHSDPQPWSAAELASKVGMSRSSFFSRFSELVGEPPVQYVTRWRLLAAADLLRSTDVTVAQVADSVGYGSEHGFSRAFRRVVGASPGEYRRTALAAE